MGQAKRKAAQQARDTAAELLNLYAQRAARQGTELKLDDAAYQRFVLQFPFEETEDQQTAIDRVLADLESTRPMDRVVCGDVGFGKTEVALRSAFVAVQAGFQVAVLVPTTLLAEQHHRTFQDRFADWPVRVELLSRFRGASGSAAAVEGLASRHRRRRDRHAQAAVKATSSSNGSGSSSSTKSTASASRTRSG